MNKKLIEKMIFMVESGEISAASALNEIKNYDNSEFNIDTQRLNRQGFEEVIYGKSKSVDQIVQLAEEFKKNDRTFLCTGIDTNKMSELENRLLGYEFLHNAGMIRYSQKKPKKINGLVSIVTAGTSDSKVAYEASETLNTMGIDNKLFLDIGVAGIHRFFNNKEDIEKSDVIIVIAGMEGALPSVVGGVFSQPVIAVPTSIGYGTALNGFTALFSMLTSCASGVTVVNIDNGFGAAMATFRILNHIPVKRK
jgi:NCAIR mutase (PurE)-related protein